LIDIATQKLTPRPSVPRGRSCRGLIAGLSPAVFGAGNFNDPDLNPASHNLAGGIPVLTDSALGRLIIQVPIRLIADPVGPVRVGGSWSIPTRACLPTVTRSQHHGGTGWNDGGRDQQAYTFTTPHWQIRCSPLDERYYNPTNLAGLKSFAWSTLTSPTGLLVFNVTADDRFHDPGW
jgi:hypothetical protein